MSAFDLSFALPVVAIPSVVAEQSGADADLLFVFQQFKKAIRVERDLADKANALSDKDAEYLQAHRERLDAFNAAIDLFLKVEEMPATTMAGMVAKARAIDWNHYHFFNRYCGGSLPSVIQDLLDVSA